MGVANVGENAEPVQIAKTEAIEPREDGYTGEEVESIAALDHPTVENESSMPTEKAQHGPVENWLRTLTPQNRWFATNCNALNCGNLLAGFLAAAVPSSDCSAGKFNFRVPCDGQTHARFCVWIWKDRNSR